ncbi:YibE/F family protein [Petroclostridium sp. X23]|uniref:YibE/F family protein n=1 Tax=Petroclostridium sp. X23 TaxID=3045146 RepID=UPI0024AE7361|nr:YibE/F family protein [Petroclostridium sp. X23]WHH57300.1 YibE/F family protein [Petroclostridium sp. X23]
MMRMGCLKRYNHVVSCISKNICMFLTAIFIFTLIPGIGTAEEGIEEPQTAIYKAKVVEIKDTIEEEFQEGNMKVITQIASLRILNKDLKGKIVEVENTLMGNPAHDINLEPEVVVAVHMEKYEGEEPVFYVSSYERINYIFQIIGIFLVLLILFGGWKGFKSIVSLGITVFLVLYVMIPLLLKGTNPILLAVGVCGVSTIATMLIIAGWNRKAVSAIIGTVGGITAGGMIAYIYSVVARLTGLGTEDAQMLMFIPQKVAFNFQGLLFAGILIGALGAAMDVSISIASALTELVSKDEEIPFGQLFKHGMNIGKDIMGTMSNTLILAYTGGALSMIMLFAAYQTSWHEVLNFDFVATEIIRSVAGSIGLLFAIPITALSFALLHQRFR